MTSDALDLAWRDFAPGDLGYVIDSWLTSYRESAEARALNQDVYYAMYRPVVEGCIHRGSIQVCYDRELPDSIMGWLCREDSALHYLHVRSRWRGYGVARWMLRDLRAVPGVYTFSTQRPPCPHHGQDCKQQPAKGPTASALLGAEWRYEPWRRLHPKETRHG